MQQKGEAHPRGGCVYAKVSGKKLGTNIFVISSIPGWILHPKVCWDKSKQQDWPKMVVGVQPNV